MNNFHDKEFDLNLAKVFLTIFETQSVSAAAKQLDLTQSAASHALKRLRLAMGDPLFVRTPSGMKPTPYAQKVAEAIGRPLEDLYLGIGIGRAFDPTVSQRTFKLYLSDVGQLVLLPRLLSFLATHAPLTKIRVVSASKVNPETALEHGEIDLAIGYLNSLVSGFYQKKLFREHYVCVVRKDHPLFRKGMSVKSFENAHHAVADSTGMAHAQLDRELASAGIRRSVQLRVPEYMVLPFVVQESDLMVIMPSRLADQFSKLVPLKTMPLPINTKPYDINVYWHSRYNADPANIWLRRSIAALFSE